MVKIRLGMITHIRFYLLPVPHVITHILTGQADRKQALKRLYIRKRILKFYYPFFPFPRMVLPLHIITNYPFEQFNTQITFGQVIIRSAPTPTHSQHEQCPPEDHAL